MAGWRGIIAWMRFARICWKWRETETAADGALPAAAGRTTSLPERNYLMTQAARLRES